MPKPVTHRSATSAEDYAVLCARWRELSQAPREDTDAQAELRQVRERLRRSARCPHECVIVEIDVPPHSASSPNEPSPFRIGNAGGERAYLGASVVPRCVAHILLALVSKDRETDQKRMTAGGNRVQLRESARISDLARQIASA